jgi:hypothetical protein
MGLLTLKIGEKLRDFAGDGVERRKRRSTGRAGMKKPRDKNNSKLSL